MQDNKKLTIWRYLIWGLVIGWIGSYIIVKFFIAGDITKCNLFQQVFGKPFSYEVINAFGNKSIKQYYEYAKDLLLLPCIGIFLGLAVGISNRSIKKTFFAILGGLTAGFLIPYYSNISLEPYFFSHIPRLLFWYAVFITLFLNIVEREKGAFLLSSAVSLILSFLATRFVLVLGWVSLFESIGRGFAGQTPETPQIFVGTIAVILLNITINFGRWKGSSRFINRRIKNKT